MEETGNTKFRGLQIDNINWKNHIIKEMIPELSGACNAIRSVVHISNINALKSIYYTYIHTYICTYIHTYVHTYIHTYICTYIHTYVHVSYPKPNGL